MKNENNNSMLAYCGLYCGACSFKVAYEENERAHLAAAPSKYDKYKNEPLQPCAGCKPDPDSCGDCGIRTCAKAKGYRHCGECADFPCVRLLDFGADGSPHHAQALLNLKDLKEMGEAKWLELQERRWKCSCGARLSWYVSKCPKCGEIHMDGQDIQDKNKI